MTNEGKQQDCKITFDTESQEAKIKLVKDIVSIANSGGGRIIFGTNETTRPGINTSTVDALDSAKISDLVEKYIKPAQIDLAHSVEQLENGKFVLEIIISPVEFPVVISHQGNWGDKNNQSLKPIFITGDVWVRHSSKNERMSYEDLRLWILSAKKQERENILERITMLVKLPDGANIQVVNQSGDPLDSPEKLLANAVLRRDRDIDHLLTQNELLWVFQLRDQCKFSEEELAILIGSALRRGATLFWWLSQVDSKTNIILAEIQNTLKASDRDKSDAARNIIELSSIYADNENLLKIIDSLRNSSYAHFQSVGNSWTNRDDTLTRLRKRIISEKYKDRKLVDFSEQELENLATYFASELSKSRTSANSKRLASVTRVIWAKKSSFGNSVLTK